MNNCDTTTNNPRAIVVLCYRRTEHLKKVLEALEQAFIVETFSLVFVVQDPIDTVLNIINSSKLQNKTILEIDGSNYLSAAQAINGNLATGLGYAFQALGSSFTVVLEDDIVIAKDALCYFLQVHMRFIKDGNFRGINGFSEQFGNEHLQNSVIRISYGMGWGWAIPLRTYQEIIRYWKGSENEHWDFIFEPFIRTGYVVNPYRSRIWNIGFDLSATHTSMNGELGQKIELSYRSEPQDHSCKINEEEFDFRWMGKAFNRDRLSGRFMWKRFIVQKFLLLIYKWEGKEKKIYLGLRRRLFLMGQ